MAEREAGDGPGLLGKFVMEFENLVAPYGGFASVG